LQIFDKKRMLKAVFNRIKIASFIPFLLCIIGFGACKKNPQLPSNKLEKDSTVENILKLNQLLAEVEREDIQKFIGEQSMTLQADSLGFWYAVTKQGKGKPIKRGMTVEMEYTLELLDGKICYSSAEKGKRILIIGKSEEERGLDLALQKLTENDQAIVLLPSHLAFGALGNRKCVPPRSPVLYRINTLKIK